MTAIIDKLLDERGGLCLSLITTAHRTSPERRMGPILMKQSVEKAVTLINTNYASHPDKNILIRNLHRMKETIDYNHLKEGLGLFISKDIHELIHFPFPVTDKVEVDDRFLLRDLQYLRQVKKEYLVLSVGKKKLRAFRGNGEYLAEIINNDFPVIFHDDYDYARSVRGTSFGLNAGKDFEKDKSIVKQIRMRDFYRSADQLVHNNLRGDQELVVYGDQKEVSAYLEITQDKDKVVDKVFSRYGAKGDTQLKSMAKIKIKNSQKESHKKLIEAIREFPVQKVAIGLGNIWKAAYLGKGHQLVVEKDYTIHGYLSSDGSKLKLRRPRSKDSYVFIKDAVENVLKLVKDLSGEIIFLDNDELKDLDRIALIKRY